MVAGASEPRRCGILREGYDYTFSRCDPATGAHVDPAWCAIYETATVADARGLLGPSIATEWSQGPDGPEWRFRIRAGARYPSRAPCDAAAVGANRIDSSGIGIVSSMDWSSPGADLGADRARRI